MKSSRQGPWGTTEHVEELDEVKELLFISLLLVVSPTFLPTAIVA